MQSQQPTPSTAPADVPRKKRIFVRRGPSTNQWATQSVKVFAGELGLPPTLLLEQLNLAGVHKQSGEEKLTRHEISVLLDYLRRAHESKKIFVRRGPSTTQWATQSVKVFAGELGLPPTLLLEQLNLAGVHKQSGEEKLTRHEISVLLDYLRRAHESSIIRSPSTRVIQNKSIHDRANAEKITQELNALDKLRNYYFSMSLKQLMALWIDGKNKLEETDAQLIRIAIRNKSGIA